MHEKPRALMIYCKLGFHGSTVSAYRRESMVLAVRELLGGSPRLPTDHLRREVFVQRYVYRAGEK